MARIRLLVEFDGTDFRGWQFQPDARTVQGELAVAVERMAGHPVVLRASSRTDAGVHAWALPVVFDTERHIPPEGWALGLNAMLPADLAVREAREVAADFDPRRASRGKTYFYQVWTLRARSALHARYCWHVPRALDLDAMREASGHLLGEHDFSAFRAAHCDSKSVHRFVEGIGIAYDDRTEGLLRIEIRANAFLRNMARIVAGTLVDTGCGRFTPADVARGLASRDRAATGQTAPAQGLFLKEVRYS